MNTNYSLGFHFGNGYFDGGKSGGIFEITINERVDIRIIPNYENEKYSYPPKRELLMFLHDAERDFLSKSEHRSYQFYTADIVFYVDKSKKDKIDHLDFSHPEALFVSKPVVYFIDEEVYKKLVRDIRDKFPFYLVGKLRGGKIWKDVLQNTFTIRFLDEKLLQLKDHLDPDIWKAIEGK